MGTNKAPGSGQGYDRGFALRRGQHRADLQSITRKLPEALAPLAPLKQVRKDQAPDQVLQAVSPGLGR